MTFSEAFEKWQKEGGYLVGKKSVLYKQKNDEFGNSRYTLYVRLSNGEYSRQFTDKSGYIKLTLEELLGNWKIKNKLA